MLWKLFFLLFYCEIRDSKVSLKKGAYTYYVTPESSTKCPSTQGFIWNFLDNVYKFYQTLQEILNFPSCQSFLTNEKLC